MEKATDMAKKILLYGTAIVGTGYLGEKIQNHQRTSVEVWPTSTTRWTEVI